MREDDDISIAMAAAGYPEEPKKMLYLIGAVRVDTAPFSAESFDREGSVSIVQSP